MTILHLTTFLQGGAGLVIAALAAAQHRAGDEVVVVTLATAEPGYGNYAGHLDALRQAGVALHAVDSLFKRVGADNQRVVDLVEQTLGGGGRFDLIHAHAAVPSAIGMTLAQRASTRVPILQTMHGWGVAKSPEQSAADVAVLNRVDRVVVPAASSAVLLDSLGVRPAQIRVVEYGVDARPARVATPHPVEVEMQRWRQAGKLTVCCAGTLGARKNQALLIEAVARLPPDRRPLCVFVGDGDADPLQALAEQLGIADAVRLCGYRADARHIVAAADVFALPSRSEGQPLAILEALCDGTLVVASGIPEIRELIEDGESGFLFEPDDPADLARTLARVDDASPETLATVRARGRARYEARHTSARMIEGYRAQNLELVSAVPRRV